MADHSENSHIPKTPTRTPAPAPSTAFPENQEPKGRTHFGPQPTPHQPSRENIFNVDKHGTRTPKDS